jgi:hypothetical protein
VTLRAARRLARFVGELERKDLPPFVVEKAMPHPELVVDGFGR